MEMVELNEKALEAAEVAWRASVSATCKLMLRDAIRAYLAALPAPDDGLEVVAWAGQGAIPISALEMDALIDSRDGDAYLYTDALVRLSDAQAALQSKDEQIERLVREKNYWQSLHDERTKFLGNCAAEKEALEEQVQKLTAENERLRDALAFYADISKYHSPLTGGMGDLYFDCGSTARSALETQEGGE